VNRGLLRNWIFEHTEEEGRKEIDNITILSYPYEKYGEFVLAFKLENGTNIRFCNLSSGFSDGLYIGYEETLSFVEYLGRRIELAFNYFKGKSNKEIEKLLNKQLSKDHYHKRSLSEGEVFNG